MDYLYLLLILYGIAVIYDTYRINKYEKVTGYVIDVKKKWVSSIFGATDSSYTHKVTYEYMYNDKCLTCDCYFYGKIFLPRIGDVKVIYVNPKKPTKVLTQDTKFRHEIVMIIGLIVLLTIILVSLF